MDQSREEKHEMPTGEVKHGGCYDCGSTEQKILTAHAIPEISHGMTAALCSKCEERRGLGGGR